MLVNRQYLDALFTGLNAAFKEGIGQVRPQWQQTAMLIKSTSAQNDYNWISDWPRMKKWAGQKEISNLEGFKYSIINEDFAATIRVRRNDIDDDQIAIYGDQARMAGYSAAQFPDEIVAELKNNAFTSKCYDGAFFYDTNHPVTVGASTTFVSNKLTAPLSATTLAAATASFGAARLALLSFKDSDGRPLNIVPSILEVPPALETTARMLMSMDRLADGLPNPYQGLATVLVNPRLISDTAWFLHATDLPVKPFVYQERKAPVFVSQTSSESDHVFMEGTFLYGVEARAAGGYGFWQTSVGSTGA